MLAHLAMFSLFEITNREREVESWYRGGEGGGGGRVGGGGGVVVRAINISVL